MKELLRIFSFKDIFQVLKDKILHYRKYECETSYFREKQNSSTGFLSIPYNDDYKMRTPNIFLSVIRLKNGKEHV